MINTFTYIPDHDNMPSRKTSFSAFDYSQKTMELNGIRNIII